MNSIHTKAELITGLGEYLKIDVTALVDDIEAELKCVLPSGQSVQQVSSSSMVIQSDQPINTNILGGSPQTNVRLLVFIADPV
jgi:hypothetical protein